MLLKTLARYTACTAVALSLVGNAAAEVGGYYDNHDVQYDITKDTVMSDYADASYEQPCRRWYAGAEATFLTPSINSAAGTIATNDVAGAVSRSFSSDGTLVEDLMYSPRVWLGVQRGDWGVVARFWHLSDSASNFDPFTAAPPIDRETSLANSRLRAYTIDIEATRNTTLGRWDSQVSAGARYANMENDNLITAQYVGVADILSGTALTTRQFDGMGLTMGWNGTRCIAGRDHLRLYAGVRGSVLWGDSSAQAQTSVVQVVGGAGAASTNFATATTSEEMFIGELQVGVQWQYELECVPAQAFIRTGLEYQYWDADGGLLASTTSASASGSGNIAVAASAGGLRTDMVGFTLAAGITW